MHHTLFKILNTDLSSKGPTPLFIIPYSLLGLYKDLSVDQWFSKCGLQISGILRNPFKGYTRSNYLQYNTKTLFAFTHCVGICTDNAKATVGNNAGALSWIKPMTLKCTRSHSILYHHILAVKKKKADFT